MLSSVISVHLYLKISLEGQASRPPIVRTCTTRSDLDTSYAYVHPTVTDEVHRNLFKILVNPMICYKGYACTHV